MHSIFKSLTIIQYEETSTNILRHHADAAHGGGIISAGEVTVTFTAGTDNGTNSSSSGTDELTKDGVTIKGSGAAFALSESYYRFNKSSTATISVTTGSITKIEFTCTANGTSKYGPGNLKPSDGVYSYNENVGTWTGNAQTINFEKSSAQVRATQIVVTYTTGDTPQKTKTTLTFTESANKTFAINETEGTTFTNVATLSPNVEGASITYNSSNTEVATVTDEGVVTVTTAKAGTTTITASYAGNDTYAASEASYTITVKEAGPNWTHTFAKGDITTSSDSASLDGVTWTIPTKAAYANGAGTDDGLQLGSSKNQLSNFILKTNEFEGTITKVIVTARASSKGGDVAVAVNNVSYNDKVTLTTSHADYTFEGSSQGELSLTFNGVVYLKKIDVYYTTSGDSKTATKITFAQGDATFQQDQNASDKYEYTNAAKVTTKDGDAVESATVTYSSSDKEHADVDANGKVTIDPTVAGTYTITATYDGDDNYAKSTASYTITVEAVLQLEGEGTLAKPYTVADAIAIVKANKQPTDSVYVKGIVTNVITTEANIAKYNNCDYYIADSEDATDQMEAYRGKYLGNTAVTSADQILKGDKVILCGVLTTHETTIELGSGNYIASFWDSKELTIDENNTNTIENARHATVTLARTFNSNAWNTLVLPFNMTAEQVTATFGSDTKLAKYVGTTLNNDGTYTLNFETTTTTITANTPVFVYGAKDVNTEAIEDVNMVAATPTTTPSDAAFAFTGSYESLTLEAGDWFISSDNNFYRAKGTETMKATRAIFRPTTAEASAKGITMVMDDKPTAISGVTADNAFNEDTPAYNLAGQRVTNNYHGLIIKRGKKYVSK